MTADSRPARRSALQFEFDLLAQNLAGLRDHILNQVFDLTLNGAQQRFTALTMLFILAGLLIGIFSHPLPEWFNALRDIFIWSFNPLARQTFLSNPFTDMGHLIVGPWSNLFRYFGVLVFPFWLALHSASLYLADIFEKPTGIARDFIFRVALSGKGETAHIKEGEFQLKDKSIIYAIGGPGHVQVDRDSVAIFEKPDGTPHVIGPTTSGAAILDGFERFRAAKDLRDQHVDLRDDLREISGRTLDGIRVSAIDVSLRFSIWRDNKPRSMNVPNPYASSDAVCKLVYDEITDVREYITKDARVESAPTFEKQMTGLARGQLGKFISERKLTEFLASIGPKEIQTAEKQAAQVRQEAAKVAADGEPAPDVKIPVKPEFVPRPDLTWQFTAKLAAAAIVQGLQLVWAGVGTWATPVEIVPSHHVEAWKLTLENAARGGDGALKDVTSESVLFKTIQLIQNAPLSQYRENINQPGLERAKAAKLLLKSYRKQLAEAWLMISERKDPDSARLAAYLKEGIAFIDEVGWGGDNGAHRPGHVV